MITITNNQIHRDEEHIGDIIGSIAWMKAKPAGRIAGQIRQVAGIDGLKFEVCEAPEGRVKLMVKSLPPGTGAFEINARAQEILSPAISAVEVVDDFDVSEPVASCDDLAAGNTFDVPADWGTPGTAYFSRCFVNHHGNDAYSLYCKANGI